MDETDRVILNRIQSDFPITAHPFRSIAENLALTEQEVLKRIRKLKRKGVIRRIGANFVPEKLGFVSTLCAAQVPGSQIEAFAEVVNKYPGVTHNYRRDGRYNVWFTFIAPSMEEIEGHLIQITRETGVENIINLPATKVFKIKAHFEL